jgi:CHAD domain-containing protein
MARAGLGKRKYRQENAFFREISGSTRNLRDREALIEALDELSFHAFRGRLPEIVGELRKLLIRETEEAEREFRLSGSLDVMGRRLEAELEGVKEWRLRGLSWKAVRHAAERSFARCEKTGKAARKSPTDENLHEWRKRAKDFIYQARLLGKHCPEVHRHLAGTEKLAELLGEARDLTMLERALEAKKARLTYVGQAVRLRAAIERRRHHILAVELVWWNASSRYKFFRPSRGGAALNLISGGSVPQERDCTPG